MGQLKIPAKKLISDENLFYILGVIEGDGSISDGEISLSVKGKDFALTFKKALEEWSGFKVSIYIYGKNNIALYKEKEIHIQKDLWFFFYKKIILLNKKMIYSIQLLRSEHHEKKYNNFW